MKKLVEFPLQDGSILRVETEDAGRQGGTARGLHAGIVTEKARETFEAALEKIQPAATTLITKLRALETAPDAVEVEFGIKLSAEAGAFVASTSGEAHFKVTLAWKRGDRP